MTEQQGEQPQGHPAWQELLNGVPEDLHPILTPKLQEWERNYSQKLQGTVEEYKPLEVYKPLVENNVDFDTVQRALWLAQKIEENPQEVVDLAIEQFDLKYAPISDNDEEDPDVDDEDYSDIDLSGLEHHPAFKQLKAQADQVQQYLDRQREEQEESQASNALQQELAGLHDKFDTKDDAGNVVVPGFDDLYVTALIAQGVEPEAAVKHFNDTFQARLQHFQQNQQQNPPVVMGGDGNTGSGIPQEVTDMGSLSNNAVNDLVIQMLNAENQT